MTLLDCRAPRSAVIGLRESRSFVAVPDDALRDLLASLAGRLVQNCSCTPEKLRP